MRPGSFIQQLGPTLVDEYDVDYRLDRMGLSRGYLWECARRGDFERRSAPANGFRGHAEYGANSWILDALNELGGREAGSWYRDEHLSIPVVFNSDGTIAINPTTGTEGTGRVDGVPVNRSTKGPWSRTAAEGAPRSFADVDGGYVDPDNPPVDFWWFLTTRDTEGLWAELFNPIIEEGGHASGWRERILLGYEPESGGGVRRPISRPQVPPAGDAIARRKAS